MAIGNSNNLNNAEDLKSQLSNLERQLISFRIADRQGIERGVIKDIYHDANGNINLLLELKNVKDKLSLRRLEYKDICQVNTQDRSIASSLSYQQLEDLPIYQPMPSQIENALEESSNYDDYGMNPNSEISQQSVNPEDIKLSLLEEKLKVIRHKHKIGEVVVRKKVETRVAKIPLRREKLIIERIGKNPEQLTEVIISEDKINGFNYDELEPASSQPSQVAKTKYINLEKAQSIIEAIAALSATEKPKIRLEIIANNSNLQQQYRDICDRNS